MSSCWRIRPTAWGLAALYRAHASAICRRLCTQPLPEAGILSHSRQRSPAPAGPVAAAVTCSNRQSAAARDIGCRRAVHAACSARSSGHSDCVGTMRKPRKPRRDSGRRLATCAAPTAQEAAPQAAAAADDLWLIVGLGNPGKNYDGNRHNVGFEVIDALARAEGISVNKVQKNALVGRGTLCGRRVLLAKPITFMNNSGEAVKKLVRFYKVPVSNVLVVYDDLDLPIAAVRLRGKGGHGGHNGMRSISAHLGGSKDFPRLRIGIGRPDGRMPIASYVLQDFSKAEREEVDIAVQESLDIVRAVLMLGVEKALSGVRV